MLQDMKIATRYLAGPNNFTNSGGSTLILINALSEEKNVVKSISPTSFHGMIWFCDHLMQPHQDNMSV